MTPARALLEWYARNGRHELPWRVRRDPYYTLVSEFMLQQTQVDRVIPKFEAFIAAFPDVAALAAASTADVLRAWQGLGYNSRAVRLKGVAERVQREFAGAIPYERDALLALKGIGKYTASAIRAFAYDCDDVAVDTNIRRIAQRIFFGIETASSPPEAEIDRRAAELVEKGRAHDANGALMDLGATICTARAPKCMLCPLRAWCSAAPIDAAALERARTATARKKAPQDRIPFEHTTRFARGRIIDRLRELPAGKSISLLDLAGTFDGSRFETKVTDLVDALQRDGLVTVDTGGVRLRD